MTLFKPTLERRKAVNIEPTGNPWRVDKKEEATVVLATDVMKVKIHGDFRERERKLFILLVHAVWNELSIKKNHTISVSNIYQIFAEITGSKNQQWIWDYFKTIGEIRVTYKSERLEGIFALLSWAEMDKEKGTITFEFPQKLIDVILAPEQWGRLRTHFLIGLNGKYSISLYQLLESKINLNIVKIQGHFDVELEELKDWLCLGGEYRKWIHFRDRVLNPSVAEINSNSLETNFAVQTETIIKNRKVAAIRFFIKKSTERIIKEKSLQPKIKPHQITSLPFSIPPFQGTVIYEQAKQLANGLDIYYLEQEWRDSVKKRQIEIKNPHAHFLGFVKMKGRKTAVR